MFVVYHSRHTFDLFLFSPIYFYLKVRGNSEEDRKKERKDGSEGEEGDGRGRDFPVIPEVTPYRVYVLCRNSWNNFLIYRQVDSSRRYMDLNLLVAILVIKLNEKERPVLNGTELTVVKSSINVYRLVPVWKGTPESSHLNRLEVPEPTLRTEITVNSLKESGYLPSEQTFLLIRNN